MTIQARTMRADEPRCPGGGPDSESPTVYVRLTNGQLQNNSLREAALHDALSQALGRVMPRRIKGPAIVKVHIGEPKCATRMTPRWIHSSVEMLRSRGASVVAAADTTVAYTGLRGHRQNPPGDASAYLGLAKHHGWSADGESGVPFIVLDRPCTGIDGFTFAKEEYRIEVGGVRRFADFYRAGGFEAAGFMVNHAHLTLHGLAGLAGCMKSLAMGCTSLPGKLRMHQSLLPSFDVELCAGCGRCVNACPEDAIRMVGDPPRPDLNRERCIGCGECEAICATTKRAVSLQGRDIDDWTRGAGTLPERMADYTIGLMAGKWDRSVHVLQMVSVTERCDCINVQQRPITKRDLGFLVGRNPFAVDRLAGRLLTETLEQDGIPFDRAAVETAEASAIYVAGTYGISPETPVEEIAV